MARRGPRVEDMVPGRELEHLRSTTPPKIPGYQIEGVLGRGATGIVYRAVQLAVERPVALKILHPELVGTKRAVRRLQREARTAARLAHPNIISAIDMGEVGGRWWYAMELVPGLSLAERLRANGPLREREALRLFIPLCDALQHAYECGVVHRDVKPANILVDERGRARLVDLGLAFAEDDPKLTKDGGTLGTPHYMSPEQARDPARADARSDIWSLGATMFHALCGEPPFGGESVAEILSGVLQQRVPEPRDLAPHLSRGMSLVLRKCLNRDPAARYQEPAELMADLESLRERRAPRVRASSLDPADSRRGARLRALGIAAAVLGVVLLLWVLVERPWRASPAGGEERPEVAQRAWPEIDGVLSNLREGLTAPGDALIQIQVLRDRHAAGDDAKSFELQLAAAKAEVERDLDRRLSEIQRQVQRAFEERLAARDLDGARALLEQELPDTLLDATGYPSFDKLPAGRDSYVLWRAERESVLQRARATAIASAGSRLQGFWKHELEPELEGLRSAKRWRSALAVLDGVPERFAAQAPDALAGLEGDLAAVLAPLDDEREKLRADLLADWGRVNSLLVQWVAAHEDRLERSLDAEGDAAARITADFEAELAAGGVVRDEIPLGADGAADETFSGRLATAVARLRTLEARLRTREAEDFYAARLARAEELCARREYEEAARAWRDALSDARGGPHDAVIRRRIEECVLLQGVLERAAHGVRGRVGQREVLYVGHGIRVEGSLRAGSQPASSGFEIQPEGQPVVRLFLGPVPPDGPSGAKSVVRTDLERLAGLSADGDATERLQLALLRFFEGDLAGARELVGARSPEGSIEADLAQRIARRAAAQDALESWRTEERDRQLAALRTRMLGGVSGERARELQQDVRRFLQDFEGLVGAADRSELESWITSPRARPTLETLFRPDTLESLPTPRAVRMSWTFDGNTGGWVPGCWSYDGVGWALAATLDQDALLALDGGPHLELFDPYDTHDRTEVQLELELPSAGPPRHTFVVSAVGFHVAFHSREGQGARYVVSAVSVEEALQQVIDGKQRALPCDPFLRGEPFRLELDVHPKGASIDLFVTRAKGQGFDGARRERLTTREFAKGPALAEKAVLALRSFDAMRLRRAEVQGKRLP